jgi:transmembrane sensor
MNENQLYYQWLLELYLQDKCTPQQASELFDFLQKDESNRVLLEQLQKDHPFLQQQEASLSQEASDRIQARLLNSMAAPRIPLYKRWSFRAAAVAAALLTGVVLWTLKEPSAKEDGLAVHTKQPSPAAPSIVPGGNKALLQLADGTVIVLDTAKNGTISSRQQVRIIKGQNGLVTYDLRQTVTTGTAGSEELNTITTPRGGQYKIVLSDGTAVWLNAASSLQFPVAFTGNERKVTLTGEGYFEVAHNPSRPFQVNVNNLEVQVLGTHFNIKGYTDENATATALLEGRVRIRSGAHTTTIQPGQQALVPLNANNIRVSLTDTEGAVAWKNGYFQFSNDNIQTIMRQIARWYDVEVIYQGTIATDKNFGGTVSRFENVAEVLKMLELTGVVHFKTEGRKITVMP